MKRLALTAVISFIISFIAWLMTYVFDRDFHQTLTAIVTGFVSAMAAREFEK